MLATPILTALTLQLSQSLPAGAIQGYTAGRIPGELRMRRKISEGKKTFSFFKQDFHQCPGTNPANALYGLKQ